MNPVQLNQRVWQDPRYFIAFGFGSGLMSFAPGTWGTLAAFPVYLLLNQSHWALYCFITLLTFVLGVWVSNVVTRDLGIQDYKGIVWDEVVGYLITMFLAPSGLKWMIIGFVLFRIFDILKPYPICVIDEKVKGGMGVMLDDVLAAVPAWLTLQLMAWSFS